MKSLKSIFSKLIYLFIILFVIWLMLLFLYSFIYKIFGLYNTNYLYKTKRTAIFLAQNNIMSPEIEKDDIVVVKKIKDPNKIKKKDIVYIREKKRLKLTRIMEFDTNKEGKTTYITKGDKNLYYSPDNIGFEDIEGKVTSISKNNFLITSFKIAISKGFTIFTSLFILLIIFIILRNRRRKARRRERREKRKHQEEIKRELRRQERKKLKEESKGQDKK